MDDTIRWSVTVSRELDRGVRALVSGKGGRAGSISGFVERAVRKELFGRTVEAVRARNREVAPEVIAAEVEAAVAQVRAVKARSTRR
jgi:Arc/MetJ-type ribon-helix-helix transcriptional regulator